MWLSYLITIGLALIISFSMSPVVMKFAKKIGAIDRPNERKVHSKEITRIGGIAIYLGFVVAFLYIYSVYEISISILIGATIIVITGLIDDLYGLKPIQKLIGQCAAAIIVVLSGLHMQYFTLPFISESIVIPSGLSIVISFIWIIGITNAINLIDGLDGLAAGTSIISSISICIIALIMGNTPVALLNLAIIGAASGFLYFNFNPAKMFMGDTGALLLGYLLAVTSVIGFKQVTLVSLVIPIIVLAVPILDTLIAIIRRKINKKGIMEADKNHLHHKLLDAGMSHRQTVLFIYAISAVFGLAAIAFYKFNLFTSSIIFVALLILTELLIEKLSLISKKYKPLINLYSKIRFFYNDENNRKRYKNE
ncbi:glycosyltransferase family 4 protein [Robertmurraya kyonggiensis]|uniref:Undecaprenyl/decaprenyl-phosphate alpha-N-acetylglucosaminyl 1-phosphate transferase n=1 Tax=Robertmurraya kyonggiensis TaxID=1037680 RepID=A0A4U1D5Q1_9BACI|nr:MraY family glycosyltransferase [Robertmurraya kyonggiensis]TKC17003.1 undecaprenyl/decaprenyl-phosphate alpha-N-acetylglucosaminyl 1-phosphate transferase [Robertmurraya kyonggiensis]